MLTLKLTGLAFKNFLGINEAIHTKNKADRAKKLAVLGALLLVAVYVACAVTVQVRLLHGMGFAKQLPSILLMAAAWGNFVFTIYGRSLYSSAGYEILKTFPVSGTKIAMSRILEILAKQILLALLILVPGGLAYGLLTKQGIYFWSRFLLAAFTLTNLSVAAALFLQTLIALATARSQHKTAVDTVLTTLVLALTLVYPMASGSQILTTKGPLIDHMDDLLLKVHPLAAVLGEGAQGKHFISFFICVFMPMVCSAVLLHCIAREHERICTRLFGAGVRHRAWNGSLQKGSVLSALYRKEAKGYFSCPIYVSNTIVGPILALIGSVILMFADPENLALPMEPVLLAPVVFAGVCCMMCSSSVSLSMEGSRIWILRSLPVGMGDLVNAKLLFSLTLLLPFWAVSEILLFLRFRPGGREALWLLFYPLAMILFSLTFGLFINMKFPNFHWKKPEEVVKQGISSTVGGLGPVLLSLLLGGLLFLLKDSPCYVLRLLIPAGAGALLYGRLLHAKIPE